jgi:SHS2 domain-containing protein
MSELGKLAGGTSESLLGSTSFSAAALCGEKMTGTDSANDEKGVGRWEHFSHGADIGLRGLGATRAEAFKQAALALTGVITNPEAVASEQAVAIHCEAPDDELLLVDWLNAVIYEMATRKMLFGKVQVCLDDHHLTATLWGEPVDMARHQPAVEVKGATYTELQVHQETDGRWYAQCVVDV